MFFINRCLERRRNQAHLTPSLTRTLPRVLRVIWPGGGLVEGMVRTPASLLGVWEAQERAEPPLGLSSSGPESRDTRPGRSVARCALIHTRPRPPTGYTYFGGVRFGGRDSAFGPCSGVFYRACEPLADRRSRHRVLTRVLTTLQPRTAGNSMHPSNMVVRGPRAESGKAQVRPQPRSPQTPYFSGILTLSPGRWA